MFPIAPFMCPTCNGNRRVSVLTSNSTAGNLTLIGPNAVVERQRLKRRKAVARLTYSIPALQNCCTCFSDVGRNVAWNLQMQPILHITRTVHVHENWTKTKRNLLWFGIFLTGNRNIDSFAHPHAAKIANNYSKRVKNRISVRKQK